MRLAFSTLVCPAWSIDQVVDAAVTMADLLNWIELAQAVQVPLLRVFGGANPASAAGGATEDEVKSAWVASAQRCARRTLPGSNDWQLALMGDGEVPVGEHVQLLRHRHYAGWICVEWEKKWHPEIPEPGVALPQYMA